jgi:hypothetical protein
VKLVNDAADGKAAVRIDSILDDYQVHRDARQRRGLDNGSVELPLSYCNAHNHHREFLSKLAHLEYVRNIDIDLALNPPGITEEVLGHAAHALWWSRTGGREAFALNYRYRAHSSANCPIKSSFTSGARLLGVPCFPVTSMP